MGVRKSTESVMQSGRNGIMKAQIDNMVSTARHNLIDMIPVSTPMSVHIDVCNICNFKCSFCSHQSSKDKVHYKRQIMNDNLFRKVIDDMHSFDSKIKVLRLFMGGEPLLHPRFVELAKYAVKSDCFECVEFTTNGSLLNKELSKIIADSGIDRVRISIEALDSDAYEAITGKRVDIGKLVDEIGFLYSLKRSCEIYVKIADVSVESDEAREAFFDMFGDICDKIFIEHITPIWCDYDNNVGAVYACDKRVGMRGQDITQRIDICPFPFYQLIVNPDGEVTVCCPDWKRDIVVGNACNESIYQIWNGKKIRRLQLEQAKGNKAIYKACKECEGLQYLCNDNIDAYGEEIVKKLKFDMRCV